MGPNEPDRDGSGAGQRLREVAVRLVEGSGEAALHSGAPCFEGLELLHRRVDGAAGAQTMPSGLSMAASGRKRRSTRTRIT